MKRLFGVSLGIPFVLVLCGGLWASERPNGRFWYDRTATRRVYASIVSLGATRVALVRPGGTSEKEPLVVPIDLLHQSDQAYIDALFRMRSAVLNLSRSPYARGAEELTAIFNELVEQKVAPDFAFYLARPAAVYLAEGAKDFRPYPTGQFVLGDRPADFFGGRWAEPRNRRGGIARGMQYPIVYAPRSEDRIGLVALSVMSHDGKRTAIRPEDFDEILIMPPYWNQPTYTPFPSRKPVQPFQRLRGPPSPKRAATDVNWKYRLVYDGRNRLWTDEAALKGHQLRFEAELTWDEAEILALLAEGKWRSYQGDDHALVDRLVYAYQSEDLPDAKEVVAAIGEYTKAIELLTRFCAMVKEPLASSDMFYLGSQEEAFPGPEMRAALWGDYGGGFAVKVIKPAGETEVAPDRALQVEPDDWQLVELSGAGGEEYDRGNLALDSYRDDPSCLVETSQNQSATPLKGNLYLARGAGLRRWQGEPRPVYSLDTRHASPTPLLAEGVRWLADAYLRRSCMYLVLGGQKRLHDALDDLTAAMQLTPERIELMTPALTIRARVRSALGQLVKHRAHSQHAGDAVPSYDEANQWHAGAQADTEEAAKRLATLRQDEPGAVATFWRTVPPPVWQEIERRENIAGALGYDGLITEISMSAARDMERRGFLFRDEAEATLNHGIAFARELFLKHGWRIVKQQKVFEWAEKDAAVRSRFEGAVAALELESNVFSPYGIMGYEDVVSDADKCLESARQFAPPRHAPSLAMTRRQADIASQDSQWRDKAARWRALLERLDYEYLHRHAPWLLTVSEYLSAVRASAKAATLKPQVAPYRDLTEWLEDELLRITPTTKELVRQLVDAAETESKTAEMKE
ncbi:MAG TPA: hypothetical protein VF278_11805 [Pirellulales bacterium]